MANTIFEQTGCTYTQVGDYMLPDLSLSAEEKKANIGVWSLRHKRYLKQNHKVLYYNLLTFFCFHNFCNSYKKIIKSKTFLGFHMYSKFSLITNALYSLPSAYFL